MATTKVVAQIGLQILLHGTEQVGLEVTLWVRISEVLCSKIGWDTDVSAESLSPFKQQPA
jgi:hypothetical protein